MILWMLACGQPSGPGVLPELDDTQPELEARAGSDLVVFVGETVTLDGAGSLGAQFSWNFGDGNTSVPASVPTASHAWDAPGHYTAFIEAVDVTGRRASDSAAVTVVWPPAEEPPRASATLAASPDDGAIWVAMPALGSLAVVSGDIVRHVPVCDQPRSVAASAGRVAVACADDAVVLVDPADDSTARIDVAWGSAPFGVVITPAGDVLATLEGTGAVFRLAADSDEPEIVPVDVDLRGLAWTPDAVLVSRHRSPDDGGRLWTLDPTTLAVAGEHVLPLAPGPDSDTATRGLPTYLQRMAVRPDGRVAVLPGLRANIERGEHRDGRPLTHETTARADLRAVALVADEGTVGGELRSAHFDDRDNAVAAAFSERGDWLYALHQGAEAIDVLDAYTLARVDSVRGTGHAPDGLVVVGDRIHVHARLSRELVVFTLEDDPAAPREIDRIDLLAGVEEPVPADVLAGAVLFHSSADQRMSFSGYMACASCHLDGTTDQRTWDFTDRGEGLRNTQSLAGRAGLAHGPLHRSANFDEVQDFEHDIRGGQAGSGLLSDGDFAATDHPLGDPKAGLSEDLDALAAFVSTLDRVPRSPFRASDGTLTEAAVRGEALFLSPDLRCADCHPPPEYTDSGWLAPGIPRLHDVGTLTDASGGRLGDDLVGLDTPTLRGAWATAPYLHDGSAATVLDVLRRAGDDHGRTSTLTDDELADLAAFVLQLE